jgi:rare lipoprotein A
MPDLRRAIASFIPAAVVALAGPAVAAAQSTTPSGGVSPTDPVQAVPVTTASPLLPAPVDLGGRIGAVLGMQVTFNGSLPGAAGRTVAVQRQDPKLGWVTIAGATAAPDGSFSAVWTVDRVGLFATRAVLSGEGAVQATSTQSPLVTVTGYRAAKATFFGPGLYGRRTACGQVLSRRLLGVAHRTLPCGTPVELYLRGRAITVPVIDRGPFGNGAHYDVTSAAAERLGLTQTATLRVAPRRGATMPAPLTPPPPFAGTGGAAPVP